MPFRDRSNGKKVTRAGAQGKIFARDAGQRVDRRRETDGSKMIGWKNRKGEIAMQNRFNAVGHGNLLYEMPPCNSTRSTVPEHQTTAGHVAISSLSTRASLSCPTFDSAVHVKRRCAQTLGCPRWLVFHQMQHNIGGGGGCGQRRGCPGIIDGRRKEVRQTGRTGQG